MNRCVVHDGAKLDACTFGAVHEINRVVAIEDLLMEQDDEPVSNDPEPNVGGGVNTRVPPYVAYSTLLTLFKELKDNGLPPQLDKSVLKRFAFGIQGQLKMALRSLGMLEGDKPTPRLKAFVDNYETDEFGPLLLTVLREVYPYIFALDLASATPTMLADAFKGEGGVKGEDSLRKCRAFFMHAAKAAGVEFGPRLLATGPVPRSPSSGVKRKPRSKAKVEQSEQLDPGAGAGGGTGAGGKSNSDGAVLTQLLAKFPDFDPAWPDEIKAKWFAGFDQFMKGAKK
jgi:hypothetical protein